MKIRKFAIYAKKNLLHVKNVNIIKIFKKVRDHCHYTGQYRGVAHSIYNLRYQIPNEIPIAFHNGSVYDYYFIIRQLAKEFEGAFECLGENTEKCITFSVPIKKEHDNDKTTIYRLKIFDSYRFMQDSLLNLLDNLSEIDNKIIASEIDDKVLQATLIKKLFNTYQLCNKDFNKFTLLLRQCVYPYEYMDSWEKFNETSLPNKYYFYSELNKKHITDEYYLHAQKVWNTFKIKNLGEYHDLYVQSDTALLADVFEKFRYKCIEIDELDPAHFLSAPGLSWKACLKKTKEELELLADHDKLLMFEEGIRGGTCQATCRYAKANNKYMKNYDKNKES